MWFVDGLVSASVLREVLGSKIQHQLMLSYSSDVQQSRDQVFKEKQGGSDGTKCDFFVSSPQCVDLFHTTILGSHPTKQLASMGIPALLSYSSLPLSLLYRSSSLPAAGARREAAKFIFSLVVPLGWWRGPRRTPADVLGEGPLRDVGGTLLLLLHLILLFLLKDTCYYSYFSSSSSFI